MASPSHPPAAAAGETHIPSTPAPAPASAAAAPATMDEHRLAELGYRQELSRDWSLVHNFGVSFSIIVGFVFLFRFFFFLSLTFFSL